MGRPRSFALQPSKSLKTMWARNCEYYDIARLHRAMVDCGQRLRMSAGMPMPGPEAERSEKPSESGRIFQANRADYNSLLLSRIFPSHGSECQTLDSWDGRTAKSGRGMKQTEGGWRLSAAKPQKCRHWGFAALSRQPPIFGDSSTLQFSCSAGRSARLGFRWRVYLIVSGGSR